MDRRRLQEAFFQYALLRVASWYPKHIVLEQLWLHDDLPKTLLNITPIFHKAFTEEYAGWLYRCQIHLPLACIPIIIYMYVPTQL